MEIRGKSVCNGIAIGKLAVFQRADNTVKRYAVEDAEAEIRRFEEARERAKSQLSELYDRALKEAGQGEAAIFEVHRMLLDDQGFTEAVCTGIRDQGVNAEFAVSVAGEQVSRMFSAMPDAYMRDRAADVRDVCSRLTAVLSGREEKSFDGEEPVILLAEDLAPSETVRLDKSRILALVIRQGSSNSHTAILARSMNIPALVRTDFPGDADGRMGIVDGREGKLILDPSPEEMERYRALKDQEDRKTCRLQEMKGQESITLDGRRIRLYANIGSVSDVENALANDAEGIGLFRSEFLYLEAADYPTEEEQFQAYRRVAEAMAGKKVIIRTLDIGADKQADYFQLDKEENPAMGYRAIRICLDRPEVFQTQLRAIYRASCYGNIAVMFPMIISVSEVRRIKEIARQVREKLTEEEIPYREIELGIMIETPAAVMMSEELGREVDFFSVGTNDLTQYTLAIDRQNPKLDAFYDPHHPAVLKMLQTAADNGHKTGCWVGICGELGADTTLTETFLRMGFDEISVNPSKILEVRKAIRSVDLRG